ncbi:MAG: KpsF/GutQ family sugar-phosphate isomerase [Chitinophagaceae bacterium]|nr:KpsF/GutQ family sugar-phosphate isomerase [Chitinophagaceae bacterium]
MKKEDIYGIALRTIDVETQSIAELRAYINDDFIHAVQTVFASKGRLVVSGIGKSAIIAQKIMATLNSTGTPALYMHAADAIHGDLGMIREEDMVMVVSKSGNSPEIKVLVPLVKSFGNTLIGMVGNMQSFLAKNADIVLNTTVSKEACPNNLAPTSSTTAQMVMGDALAVCLMELRGFSGDDFAKFHPGGMLGKQLYLRVRDLFMDNEKPAVHAGHSLKQVILEMTRTRLGATAVINEEGDLVGFITDGDLRRMLQKDVSFNDITAEDIMTKTPKTIHPDELAVQALDLLRKHSITHLVVAEGRKYSGILHLHDLVKEGLI